MKLWEKKSNTIASMNLFLYSIHRNYMLYKKNDFFYQCNQLHWLLRLSNMVWINRSPGIFLENATCCKNFRLRTIHLGRIIFRKPYFIGMFSFMHNFYNISLLPPSLILRPLQHTHHRTYQQNFTNQYVHVRYVWMGTGDIFMELIYMGQKYFCCN